MKTPGKSTTVRCPAAFTLIEIIVATILIGIVISAIVMSSRTFTTINAAGMNLTTAEFLIEEIRELAAPLPVVDPDSGTSTFGPESDETSLADYDDLDDFDGAVFSPPIDINRTELANFPSFSQQVTVENVSASDFMAVVGDHSSDFVRVTVRVFLNNDEISSASWIRAQL